MTIETQSHLKSIDPNIMKAKRIEGWIAIGVYFLITVALVWLTLAFSWPVWIMITAAILTFLLIPIEIIVFPRLRYQTWRYGINEHEIELEYGIIIRRRTLIPMVRIQHVDSKQGPIQKHYGLTTIIFSTAAGSHTFLL